jgi:SAM-dependent methyltransferase
LRVFINELRFRLSNFFINELRFRLTNYCCEQYLGVATAGKIDKRELGLCNPDLVSYMPLGYKAIWMSLRDIPLDKSQCTFLDYGCGKGRAIVAAATLPFKRVIGVEISDWLIKSARENVDKMRWKKTIAVDLENADAIQYCIPSDVNIIYFFNPFRGVVLQKVISNIYESYRSFPRDIYIIFFNDIYFKKILNDFQNDFVAIRRQGYVYSSPACAKMPYSIYVTKTHRYSLTEA